MTLPRTGDAASRTLVGLGALIACQAPATAWACGLCTENMVEKLAWWATFPVWFFVALLVDALAFFVYCRVRRIPAGPSRPWLVLLVASGIILLVGIGAGSVIPAAIASVALGIKYKRSFKRLAPLAPQGRLWATRIRLGVLTCIVLAGGIRAFPPLVPTDRLLEKASYGLWTRGTLAPENWMEEELRRRHAVDDIQAAIERERASNPELLGTSEARYLRLHLIAGGSAPFRELSCERWRAHRERSGVGPLNKAMDAMCPQPHSAPLPRPVTATP